MGIFDRFKKNKPSKEGDVTMTFTHAREWESGDPVSVIVNKYNNYNM